MAHKQSRKKREPGSYSSFGMGTFHERITPELELEIRLAIRHTDVDGFYLNRRFWFLGGWINHCGYFPSWNLRLFRHRLGRYEQIEINNSAKSGDNEVHEHVLLDGRSKYLSAPMEHYAFPDIATRS